MLTALDIASALFTKVVVADVLYFALASFEKTFLIALGTSKPVEVLPLIPVSVLFVVVSFDLVGSFSFLQPTDANNRIIYLNFN